MESRNTSISASFGSKREAALFVIETLDNSLLESTGTTYASTTIIPQGKSGDYYVNIVTA